MRIYTKAGDGGETRLFGGTAAGKDSTRVSAYGELDELNACLGLARNHVTGELAGVLERIQSRIFELGAELSSPRGKNQTITDVDVGELEAAIDRLSERAAPLRNFVLPAGGAGAAELHLARTVCRRAERAIVTLHRMEPVRGEILRYVNRLSDLLFVMARAALADAGLPESQWAGHEGGDQR
jgi:cob(I)alamin adenosyltransferase